MPRFRRHFVQTRICLVPDEERNDHPDFLGRLITVLLRQPWLELVEKAWKIMRKLTAGWSHQGVYEVLEYDLTLELKDRGGK